MKSLLKRSDDVLFVILTDFSGFLLVAKMCYSINRWEGKLLLFVKTRLKADVIE